ncbi:hypothetical protein [Hwangdonia sp.]|uniref:hypothetical protein n=1 Tax=Hwangdonia sp. TaxID=1883432 RepID=UPI003AB757A0
MNEQSYNLNANFVSDFTGLFVKFVAALFLIYALVLIINLLRDKFVKTEADAKNADYLEFFTILNRLFFISGFGFVIANLITVFFSEINNSKVTLAFVSEWKYLTFGIILIFIGISFKSVKKRIVKERNESLKSE